MLKKKLLTTLLSATLALGFTTKASAKDLSISPTLVRMMNETDELLGLKKGSTKKQLTKESSLKPGKIYGPRTKFGIPEGWAQFVPSTVAMYRTRFRNAFGWNPNPQRHKDAILLNRLYMADLLRKSETYTQALYTYGTIVHVPSLDTFIKAFPEDASLFLPAEQEY